MSALLRVFLDIALLRRGPQVLPGSPLLLVLSVALYAATFVAVLSTTAIASPVIFGQLAASLVIDVVGLWLILAIARRDARYLQVLTAVLGSAAILHLVLLPAALATAVGGEGWRFAATLWAWAVLGWTLAVLGHILRHALETDWARALALAAFCMFFSILAQRALGI